MGDYDEEVEKQYQGPLVPHERQEVRLVLELGRASRRFQRKSKAWFGWISAAVGASIAITQLPDILSKIAKFLMSAKGGN